MTTQSVPIPSQAATDSWRQCSVHALERLPLKARWFIVLFVVAGVLYTAVTTYISGDPTWNQAREGASGVLMCTFILIDLQFIKRRSMRALVQLRPVVAIPEERYQRFARLILHADLRVELLLAAIAVPTVLALYKPWLPDGSDSPLRWIAAIFFVLYGMLMLWILLALIYMAVRSSLALRGLARSPLIVNAFDPTALLPFGQLTAYHSLALIIAVSIPMALLGRPTDTGYAVLSLSLLSLAVLFVPIWGVHRQIVHTRQRVLETLSDDLMGVQTKLLASNEPQITDLAQLHQEAQQLSDLRKMVLSGPTWPFRDYGTVIRVVTAVFLPTLVAFLSLFIERNIFPLIQR